METLPGSVHVGSAGWLHDAQTLDGCIDGVTAELPDASAILDAGGRGLSFAELAARKRQYLRVLDEHAIGPGECVGLHGSASADHLAAMLALMHRGAVAVPLAADLPRAYRAALLDRAGASLVLTDTPDSAQAIGWLPAGVSPVPDSAEPAATGAETPFLLMFTSGSTGEPKGVLHAHRQPMNRFRWMSDSFPLGAGEVCAARPTVSIMPSIWELFGGLCTGHPTVLLDPATLHDPARWVRRLAEARVTRMTATPSLLRVLLTALAEVAPGDRPPLRLLTVGGERLPDRLVRLHRTTLPGCALLEDYGATEVNTIGAGLRETDGRPLYRPIDGVRIGLADEHGAPLRDGDTGELCVAGAGLALCYWGDAAQTGERFGSYGGFERAYRTGDLARLLPDGRFELLGRTRDQTKINGLTVDLVSIERALRELSGVDLAAAFTVRPDGGDWTQLCAAVVGADDLTAQSLREALRDTLPAHMLPSRIMLLADLPRLPSGKPDRAALPALLLDHPPPPTADSSVESVVRGVFAQITGLSLGAEDMDATWDVRGLDSVSTVAFAQAVATATGLRCAATDLFDHPTPRRLLTFLAGQQPESAASRNRPAEHVPEAGELAVSGMAAMVPGAPGLDALWTMIRDGRVEPPRVALERWPDEPADDPDLRGTFLADAMGLDARLHGLSPAEARHADPQLRLVLRAVRQCLQDAGLSRDAFERRRVGVFLGCRPSGFLAPDASRSDARSPEAFLGSDEAMMAARVAHLLDLHGPAITVNTTCSSGLVALHVARRAIAAGDCDMAIVCAVSVVCHPDFLRKTARLGVTSPSGACRPFDAAADGFVPSEGVGCVLVEDAGSARRSGRSGWARVLASGLNHDGLSKSLTSPNGAAQAALLEQLYAGRPGSLARVAYLEAHGTGTALGDPVECGALMRVWAEAPERPVAIGSIKGNIGHANAAAGLLGLIKTALSLHHRTIPPLAGFADLNPRLPEEVLRRFDFPVAGRPWPGDRPLAGVSAFGMSGTNAHVLLGMEEARPAAPLPAGAVLDVPVSAPSREALRAHALALADQLAGQHAPALTEVAATLRARTREAQCVRLAARDVPELVDRLRDLAEGRAPAAADPAAVPPPAGASIVHLAVSGETGADQVSQRMVGPASRAPDPSRDAPAAEGPAPGLARVCGRYVGELDWSAFAETPFRELGLDSIRAISLRDSLRESCGLDVSLYDLLEGASLASLRARLGGDAPDQPPAGSPETDGEPLPEDIPDTGRLTDLQSVYLTAKLTGTGIEGRLGAWNVLVLDPAERLDHARLASAWAAVRRRHGMLRVRVSPGGLQQIGEPSDADLPLSPDADGTCDTVAAAMLREASGVSGAPMARLHLLRGDATDRLVVGVDSFAADARSTRIFLDDLWTLYAGRTPAPDLNPRAFLGIMTRRRAMITPEAEQAARQHWARRIAGHEPATVGLLVPESRRRGPVRTGWTRLDRTLTRPEAEALSRDARTAGVPVVTALFARFRRWVAVRAAGPVLIGMTVAERPHGIAGAEHVVGPFTEMMLHPIGADGSDEPAAVQAALAADLGHRALSGTAILRELSLDPPRVVFSSVTQQPMHTEMKTVRALSITSGLHLHAHVTRDARGGISLEWDVNLAELPLDAARELFDSFCRALGAGRPEPQPGGPDRAPLTRAMRSYQATQAAARGAARPSYAMRTHRIDPHELPAVHGRWQRLLDGHAALHGVQTPHGQVRTGASVAVAGIAHYEAEPGHDFESWLARVRDAETRALASRQWPPMRLATGVFDGQQHLIFVFDCHALDAPATLILPRMLLTGHDLDADPEAGFGYARWQHDHPGDEHDRGYWRTRLDNLAPASLPALEPSVRPENRMWQCRFPRPADLRPEEIAAAVATAFQNSLAAFPALAALPTMVVGYHDRAERPGWRCALGDFTVFGFLAPGCADAGPEAVRASLDGDREHRRADWFPLLSGRAAPGRVLFPTAFTDALSAQDDFTEPAGAAAMTASHTEGLVIDCLTYSTGGEIAVEWSVDTSAADPGTVDRAFAQFRQGLPDTPEPAGSPDAATFQAMQNRTASAYDERATMVRLFERAAARYAGHVAVVDDNGAWSYEELAAAVEHNARLLAAWHGIGPGDVVAVRMRRDRRLPAVLLAILKLGAAFVPLATDEPTERHNRMLRRSGARLIIVAEPDAELVVDAVEADVLESADSSGLPSTVDASTSDGLAYVIFTSGSTGEPKGVMVRHRPVINLFEDLQKRYGFGPSDRGIWVNSVGFDLTIFDVFGLLAQGASLRVVNEQDRLDPLRIARIIGREPVTFWNSAPAYFHAVIGQLLPERLQGTCDLRLAFLSGDWVPLSLARQCLEHLPRMRTVALGGATEAVVWSNLHEIREVRDDWLSIPYGRPIQNARYHVLDGQMNPVAVGEPGELYIGGACLADGYINAPELTERAFVPDPFVSGGTVYRTGDLARFMPDGEIEFLGRADRQVKIRGHRIELGEIEHAMEKAGYSTPVVLATEGGQGSAVSRSLVGFCVGAEPDGARDRLAALLPGHMRPPRIVALDAYPTTANGKLDHRAMLGTAGQAPVPTVRPEEPGTGQVRETVMAAVAELLEVPRETLDLSLGLGHQGFNSLHFALLANSLSEVLGQDVATTDILALPSLDAVLAFAAERFVQTQPEPEPRPLPDRAADETDEAIAVIGLYCRMPEADGPEEFWRNLASGRDCVTEIPESRWDWQAIHGADPERDESLSRWGGFLSQVDEFDPGRFSISPREAAAMDPRQRLTLTGAWTLMEEAGYAPITRVPSRTGLFLGVTGDEYGALLAARGVAQDHLTLVGTGRSFIANRINYAMNWSGPSEVIDTTCSSSLVAIHHAVSALRGGDCEMAVAGGVSVLIDPSPHVSLSKVGVLSPEGRCKTFDSRADGYVRSEGIGLVLLKPLARALADGDRVRAVIRACRINHGGRSTAMTAPNAAAQAALVDAAFAEAGPGIAGLALHESHGTGTRLGDPIEVSAYQQAVRAQLSREGMPRPSAPISMGSVKSAIGHAEAAAGVAGFIAAVLALQRSEIPPLVHFRERNPEIAVDSDLLRFDTAARPWPAPVIDAAAVPRRASVSAFGFGGVNAFAVLEQAPDQVRDREPAGPDLFVVSARSSEDLRQQLAGLADWIEGPGADAALGDIAFTLRSGRVQDRHRFAVVARTRAELVAALRSAEPATALDPLDTVPTNTVPTDTAPTDTGPPAERALADALGRGALTTAAQLWRDGADADWSLLKKARQSRPRRVALPLSALHERPYWHPGLHRDPAARRATWRRFADGAGRLRVTARDGFLADHVLGGVALLPAAGWLAAAVRVLGGPGGLSLRDVAFRAPLILDGAPNADVMVVHGSGELTFARAGDPDTVLCSTGFSRGAVAPGADALASHSRTYETGHDAEDCARVFADLDIDYGPLYRVVRACWHAPDEALVQFELPGDTSVEDSIAVPVLDALFQSVVLFEALNGRRTRRVPVRAGTVDFLRDPGRDGYVRVRPSADGRRHDAWLYDARGRLCVHAAGIMGHEMPAARAAPARADGEFVGYTPVWVPAELPPAAGYDTAVLPWHGSQSLHDIKGWAASDVPGLTVLIDPSGTAIDVSAGCATLVQTVCASLPSIADVPRSVVLLLPGTADWAGPVSAGLAGLAETIRLEHPSLSIAVLVTSGFDRAQVDRLHTARSCGLFRARSATLETIALRPIEQSRTVPVAPEGDPAGDRGFVLISGGAGYAGSEIGRLLAARGVPVVALGRTAAPARALADGVHYQAVDVTDADRLATALRSWRARLGPVTAVYHCAGLTPGGLFARRDAASIAAQLDVKLSGAATLDAVTAADAPAVFAGFSSLAAHVGVVGCADYAMANRAMEGFITARAASRPGRSVSLAWSAWPEGGMRFTGEQAARLAAEGIEPVPPEAALDWIGRVLAVPGLTVAVSPFGRAEIIRGRFGGLPVSAAANREELS